MMTPSQIFRIALVGFVSLTVAACGNKSSAVSSTSAPSATSRTTTPEFNDDVAAAKSDQSSIWDIFGPDQSVQTGNVNRYLWNASLDVLGFLPVQSVDPYTGVIITGYGTPPGGGRSYRATIHIKDPALDPRSLNVALQSKGGAVSPATARAVEDAILSRARQLRIADGKL